MKVYIASKMTGLENYGIENFDRMKKKMEGLGFSVLSPADIANKYGTEHPREFYMRRCVELILEAQAVVLFGDWKNSRGALFEEQLAIQLGLPVFEFIDGRGCSLKK